MQIQNKEISITNGIIKRASLVEERFEDVENPELFIKELKELKNKPDIFTFIQRLSLSRLDKIKLDNDIGISIDLYFEALS